MGKEINVGIIGTRFMGKAHSNAYINANKFFDLPAEVVMKAACGRNAADLEAFAKKFGWQSTETDWRKLIARDDIDLIDICTSTLTHLPIAVAAAKAGKHIFCEKPLSIDSGEGKKMLGAAREAGVKHMVAFNYRRVPAIAHAKKLIDEGKLGKIYNFNAVYYQDWLLDPEFPFVWRLDSTECGAAGAAGEMNGHLIDLARYLVGEIEAVCGDKEILVKERPTMDGKGKAKVTTDDSANVIARFRDGAMASFLCSRFAAGRRNYLRLEIFGSKGSLVFNLERMNELQYYCTSDEATEQGFRTILVTESGHKYIDAWWPPGHIIGWEHTFVHEVADMIEAIGNDKDIYPDFYDGLRCQQVVDAIIESTEQGKWVTVPEK